MLGRVFTAKAMAILGTLALGATTAAAATGNLPAAAQNGLATAASHVGITLPASHDNHPTKDDHPGGTPTAATPTTPTTAADHGNAVSQVAHSTDATGRAKGAAVSAVARGDHGKTSPTSVAGPDVTTPSTDAPVATPNAGGTATGSTASNGANTTDVGHAAPQAGQGSANAGTHPTGP